MADLSLDDYIKKSAPPAGQMALIQKKSVGARLGNKRVKPMAIVLANPRQGQAKPTPQGTATRFQVTAAGQIQDARQKIGQRKVGDARQKIIGKTKFVDARVRIQNPNAPNQGQAMDARQKIQNTNRPLDVRQKLQAKRAQRQQQQPQQSGQQVVVTGLGRVVPNQQTQPHTSMTQHGPNLTKVVHQGQPIQPITKTVPNPVGGHAGPVRPGPFLQQQRQQPHYEKPPGTVQIQNDMYRPPEHQGPPEQQLYQHPHQQPFQQQQQQPPQFQPRYQEPTPFHAQPAEQIRYQATPPAPAQAPQHVYHQPPQPVYQPAPQPQPAPPSAEPHYHHQQMYSDQIPQAPAPQRVKRGHVSHADGRVKHPTKVRQHVDSRARAPQRAPAPVYIEPEYHEMEEDEEYMDDEVPYEEEEDEYYQEDKEIEEEVVPAYQQPPRRPSPRVSAPARPSPIRASRSPARVPATERVQPDPDPDVLPSQDVLSPVQGFKVMVTNLHPIVSQEDIVELFGSIGPMKKARMIKNGMAEVIFVKKKDAITATRKYHLRELDGQPMSVTLINKDPPPRSPSPPPPAPARPVQTQARAPATQQTTAQTQVRTQVRTAQTQPRTAQTQVRTAQTQVRTAQTQARTAQTQARPAQTQTKTAQTVTRTTQKTTTTQTQAQPKKMISTKPAAKQSPKPSATANVTKSKQPLKLGASAVSASISKQKSTTSSPVDTAVLHKALFRSTSSKEETSSKPVTFTVKI